MKGRDYMSIAMMCIPLAFAMLIWAFNAIEVNVGLSVVLWVGAAIIFICAAGAWRKAEKLADENEENIKRQNEKLIDVLEKIEKKLQ